MMIEDNKTTFELMASRYDEIICGCPYYYNQREAETEMIYKLVPNSARQEKGFALDVGCGTGDHSLLLLRKGYFVTGIDPSLEMLKLAKIKTREYKNKINFYNGRIENLKNTQDKFQVVIVCGSVLNLLPNWEEFFRKVGELLSKRGVLIISFDNMLSIEHFCWLLNSLVKFSGVKECFFGLKKVLRNFSKKKLFSEVWPFLLEGKKLPVKLHYMRLEGIKKLLAYNKIKIKEIWGVNFFTCFLPSVLYSSVDLNPKRYEKTKLFWFLKEADRKIRKGIYPLASNVIIIGYKEKN